MKIPYVIDNQTHRMSEILPGLLEERRGFSLDVAKAYFAAQGFGLLQKGLEPPGKSRSITANEVHYGILNRTLNDRGFAYFCFRDDAASAAMADSAMLRRQTPQGESRPLYPPVDNAFRRDRPRGVRPVSSRPARCAWKA